MTTSPITDPAITDPAITDSAITAAETITVGLVGCASQKLQRAAPARELYVSQLFKKASAYAEGTCDRWCILSAKHGVVHPDTVLEPYDMKLGTLLGPPIKHWAAVVRNQLADEIADIEDLRLVALCGGQYRTALEGGKWKYATPMEGMGIGQQLAWLTAQLKGRAPSKER